MSDSPTSPVAPLPTVRVAPKSAPKPPKKLPPYHVVLLDDDHHSYEYVIVMLQALFGHPLEKAFEMAKEVDSTGRVIVLTTTKEHAELKRDQIHAFGPDKLIASCEGAMSSVIEPSE
jgi:ATP-dependent Clp protease adaptor protein ClpS